MHRERRGPMPEKKDLASTGDIDDLIYGDTPGRVSER